MEYMQSRYFKTEIILLPEFYLLTNSVYSSNSAGYYAVWELHDVITPPDLIYYDSLGSPQ